MIRRSSHPQALSDELDVRIEVPHLGVRVFEEIGYTLDLSVIIDAVDNAGFVCVMVVAITIAAEMNHQSGCPYYSQVQDTNEKVSSITVSTVLRIS